MTGDLQNRLLDAVMRCMRPVARMLMGAGISYSQFEEIAKRAFVGQALGEPDARGRTVNISRVAVRTGLSRKEVARVKLSLETLGHVEESTLQIGRPARVLQLWHSEPEFLDDQGAPIDLPFDDGHPTFSSLTKRVGGDVPAGAVRAELLSAGGMIELPNGRYRVQRRFFVPSALDENLVAGFAFIVAPLLETLRHNMAHPSEAFIQRVAYSDFLRANDRADFRQLGHDQAANLMNSVDRWLAEHEVGGETSEDASRRVGVGVFYFETGR